MKVQVKSLGRVQLFATPWTPGSLPGSAVYGIFQARILEWAAISFSRGSSQPKDWTQVSCIADRCFTVWATGNLIKPTPLNLIRSKNQFQITQNKFTQPSHKFSFPWNHFAYRFLCQLRFDQGSTTSRMVCDKWFIIEVKLYTVMRIGGKCYSLCVWLWTWNHVYGANAQQTNLDRRYKGEQGENKTHRELQVHVCLSPVPNSRTQVICKKSGTFAIEQQLSLAHDSEKLQERIQLGAECCLPSFPPSIPIVLSSCELLLEDDLRVCSVTHFCPTLCCPMDGSPPGSFVHGTLQARILEWVAIFYSRGSSLPRDRTHVSCISCIARWILYQWATCKA